MAAIFDFFEGGGAFNLPGVAGIKPSTKLLTGGLPSSWVRYEHLARSQPGILSSVNNADDRRPAVYDSGVAVAFCLDGLIREYTGGDKSLNDMMKLMENRYGKTGIPIVFADIAEAASETAESDLSDFFSAHVEARQPLPVSECAGRMGYRALVDGYHVYLERVR